MAFTNACEQPLRAPPRPANLSVTSTSRFTSEGQREILGRTWVAGLLLKKSLASPLESVSPSGAAPSCVFLSFCVLLVVRSASSHKIFTVFGEVRRPRQTRVHLPNSDPQMQGAALQAERRGNFVVIGCVEGSRVVSWSLNVRSSLVLIWLRN